MAAKFSLFSAGDKPEKEDALPPLPEKAVRDVSASTEVLNDKRRLPSRWSVWHGNPRNEVDAETGRASYRFNQTEIAVLSTVEDWALHTSALARPSRLLGRGIESHQLWLFRTTIEPRWEDPSLVGAGRWQWSATFTIQTPSRASFASGGGLLPDEHWLRLQAVTLSETLPHAEDIVGCGVELRGQKGKDGKRILLYRFQVWTKRAEDAERQKELGRALAHALSLPIGKDLLEFYAFSNRKEAAIIL